MDEHADAEMTKIVAASEKNPEIRDTEDEAKPEELEVVEGETIVKETVIEAKAEQEVESDEIIKEVVTQKKAEKSKETAENLAEETYTT